MESDIRTYIAPQPTEAERVVDALSGLFEDEITEVADDLASHHPRLARHLWWQLAFSLSRHRTGDPRNDK